MPTMPPPYDLSYQHQMVVNLRRRRASKATMKVRITMRVGSKRRVGEFASPDAERDVDSAGAETPMFVLSTIRLSLRLVVGTSVTGWLSVGVADGSPVSIVPKELVAFTGVGAGVAFTTSFACGVADIGPLFVPVEASCC
jgi:hypothetical protein